MGDQTMSVVIKWSVILTALVAVVTIGTMRISLGGNPIVGGLVFLVLAIVLNLGVVFMALRETAAENAYGKQLVNGVAIGAVAGLLIFGFSFVNLSYISPDYLDRMPEVMGESMASMGASETQVAAAVEEMENTTPLQQSIGGLIGTFFTSLIGAALIGIVVRKKTA